MQGAICNADAYYASAMTYIRTQLRFALEEHPCYNTRHFETNRAMFNSRISKTLTLVPGPTSLQS